MVAYVRRIFQVIVVVPLKLVSLKCCSAFGSKSTFKSVNLIKIPISLSMLGYPFEGILGRLVAAGLSFFIFTPKKVPAINCVSEWSSVPNILESNNQ